ncbi:hypothetical protein MXB_3759 [Myxobolus squamalis]|nr:hypothetical protein MXB_3759 [Myxobolus squamalis]
MKSILRQSLFKLMKN